jgi:hypothetical protein
LEEAADRADVLNDEAAGVANGLRAVLSAGPLDAGAAGVALQLLSRWQDLLHRTEAEAEILAMLLAGLRLLLEHQVNAMPMLTPPLERWPVLLPGGPSRVSIGQAATGVAITRPAPGPPPDKQSAVGALLLVLAALAAAAAAAGLAGGLNAITRAEFNRQQKQKAVSQALAAAPKPPLPPDQEEEVARNARELEIDPARFEALARDPAKGGEIDENSIEEARLAVRLERTGRLADVVRSPAPEADLIEDGGAGQTWDVKSFRSDTFDLGKAMTSTADELRDGNNVIVNTAHLDPGQVADIQRDVEAQGWSDRVIIATSE